MLQLAHHQFKRCSFCTSIKLDKLSAEFINTLQIVFDPGVPLRGHSVLEVSAQVFIISFCSGLPVFSPPPFPPWLLSSSSCFYCCVVVWLPVAASCLPSSPAYCSVSLSLCFCLHLLLPVLSRSSHVGHGHLQTRHHDHLTQQAHRGGGQLLQGQRPRSSHFMHWIK